MTHTTLSTSGRAAALRVLFHRYLSGDIADQLWQRISAVLDADNVSPDERLAFASSVNHWLDRRDEGQTFPAFDDVRLNAMR